MKKIVSILHCFQSSETFSGPRSHLSPGPILALGGPANQYFAGLQACRLCTRVLTMILCRPCFFLPCFQNGDEIQKDFQEISMWTYPATEMSYFQLFSFTLFCFMFKKSLQLIYCRLYVIYYIIFSVLPRCGELANCKVLRVGNLL